MDALAMISGVVMRRLRGPTDMRVVRVTARICAIAILASPFFRTPEKAYAAMTGTILLRGEVPARAVVSIRSPITDKGSGSAAVPGAPSERAVELGPVSSTRSAAVFHLDRLANSSSGFVVKLSADSGAAGVPTMTADDGTSLPYQVRFGGRDVAFSDGEADLATVTRDTENDEASGLFEIIAPAIPATRGGLADHIVLIVAAR